MPLQVRYFDQSLPGAPSLTGQVGTLVTLLDAVLVNGFNTKTISGITRSGSTATATTSTAHGYAIGAVLPLVLAISGADQAEYNGNFVVTVTSTTQFTFTVSGTPATPATSTGGMSCKVAPLGWTKAFSGTNVASYKMPAGSSGMYLGVDDNAASGAQYTARIRGFETMSAAGVAVASGTGPFPTDSQVSGGGWWHKSITQDGTARNWRVIGDDYGFFIETYPSTQAAGGALYYFGDFSSTKAGDVYNCLATTLQSSVTTLTSLISVTPFAANGSNVSTTAGNGQVYPRSYTQTGGAVLASYLLDGAVTNTYGQGGLSYPHGPDNGFYLSGIRLLEPSISTIRGSLLGLYQVLHNKPLSDGDIITNVVGLTGRTFLLTSGGCSGGISYSDSQRYAFDVTGPWR